MPLGNRIFGERKRTSFNSRRTGNVITRIEHRTHVMLNVMTNLTFNERRLLDNTKVPLEQQKLVKELPDKPAMVRLVARRKFLTDMYIRHADAKVIDKCMYPKWISRVKDN